MNTSPTVRVAVGRSHNDGHLLHVSHYLGLTEGCGVDREVAEKLVERLIRCREPADKEEKDSNCLKID